MNRKLQLFNTIGVLALAVLCIVQWRANRTYNLEVNRLEQVRIDHEAQVEDLSKKLKGYTEDLESFRQQIARTTESSRDVDKKLSAAERQVAQLASENEQLKTSVTNWTAAVTLRDDRLKEANARLQTLSEQLNSNIVAYNKLATNYNQVVSQLETARNALVKKQETAPKPAN